MQAKATYIAVIIKPNRENGLLTCPVCKAVGFPTSATFCEYCGEPIDSKKLPVFCLIHEGRENEKFPVWHHLIPLCSEECGLEQIKYFREEGFYNAVG